MEMKLQIQIMSINNHLKFIILMQFIVLICGCRNVTNEAEKDMTMQLFTHTHGGNLICVDGYAYVAHEDCIYVYDDKGTSIEEYRIVLPLSEPQLIITHLNSWDTKFVFRNSNNGTIWISDSEFKHIEAIPNTHNSLWCYVNEGILYHSGTNINTWNSMYSHDLGSGKTTKLIDGISQRYGAHWPTPDGLYYISENGDTLCFSDYEGNVSILFNDTANFPVVDLYGDVYYIHEKACYKLGQKTAIFGDAEIIYSIDDSGIWFSPPEENYPLMYWSFDKEDTNLVIDSDITCYQKLGCWYYYVDVKQSNFVVGVYKTAPSYELS